MNEELPLTPRAKKALAIADKVAREIGHSYISTEHIFVGLLSDPSGTPVIELEALGIDSRNVINQCLVTLGAKEAKPVEQPEAGKWVSVKEQAPVGTALTWDGSLVSMITFSDLCPPSAYHCTHWTPLPEPPSPPKSEAGLAWEKHAPTVGLPANCATIEKSFFLAGYAASQNK